MKIFTLPDVGEGLTEADLVNWLVAVGDTVTVNQVVAEIETAKSLVEIPSPWAGTVQELYVEIGDTINVGDDFFAIQVSENIVDDDDEESPQAPLVGSGPKNEPARRRRRRPGRETRAEIEPTSQSGTDQNSSPVAVLTSGEVQKSDLFAKVLAKPPVEARER